MRLFIFAFIVLFPISSIAAGSEFFPSDWWEDDWWEQEEPVIIQKPSSSPQQNIQRQKSIQSIQKKLEKLQKMLEQKRERLPPPEYRQRKK